MMKIVLVTLLVAGCSKSKDRQAEMFGESKGDIAKATVKKYAYEAYPSWAAAHPDIYCPSSLDALNEYMNTTSTKDPWGFDYRMQCGANLPANAKGIAVQSSGEDGKFDTADDLNSWE